MKLIAIKTLPTAAEGETFDVPANHAHVLKLLGWAKDAGLTPESEPEHEPEPELEPTRSRRTYRRRDLQAEDTAR